MVQWPWHISEINIKMDLTQIYCLDVNTTIIAEGIYPVSVRKEDYIISQQVTEYVNLTVK
jgi:hypothetical protein